MTNSEDTEELTVPEDYTVPDGHSREELVHRWVELGLLISWASERSRSEVDSLSRYIEEQAEALVENFRAISEKAHDQSRTVTNIVETSTNIVLDGQALPLSDVVKSLDDLISFMINDVLEISKQAMNMVYVMQKAVADSKEVNAALEDIFKITKDTKYLSINALIEAERAGGDTGKSFGVVAKEVRDLSQDTRDLAEKMNALITGLSGNLDESFIMLEDIASRDMTKQIEMKDHVNKTLSALIEQSAQHKKVLENTVSSAADISNIVSRLIMAMQFQDYAKQRMQHLNAASEGIQDKVEKLTENSRRHADLSDLPHELPQEMIDDLLKRFSLSRLKEDFLEETGETPSPPSTGTTDENAVGDSANHAEDEDDIELF